MPTTTTTTSSPVMKAHTCLFCEVSGDRKIQGTMLERKGDNKKSYYVHENCLYYSTRKNIDEMDISLIKRIKSSDRVIYMFN